MTIENNLDVVLKAGSLLVIQYGAYSDTTHSDPVRVVKDATMQALADAFEVEWESDITLRHTQKDWYGTIEDLAEEEAEYGKGEPKASAFLPWLVREGYVEDAGLVCRWHVGSYSDFDPKWHVFNKDTDNG